MKQDIVIGKVWKTKGSTQCTIPKDFSDGLGIDNGDSIVFTKVGNSIIITKLNLDNQ
jgi:bifunctional DNA-binding transcriptional regulator/antitoxin component of YhaV-PrlF toxin-antitoxin module